MKCEYGCGREAKYPPGKGRKKWCCSEFPRLCKHVKKSYGSSGDKNPMYGKKQTTKTKDLISKKLSGGKINRTYKPIKINTNKLCDFGCNKKAKFKLKNSKLCCSKHQSSCFKIKQKIRKGVKGKMVGNNHPFYNKTHTDKVKKEQSKRSIGNKYSEYTYETFLEKYPFFLEYEEIRKTKEGGIQVRCKECNIWFQPDKYYKIVSYRACAIKHPSHGLGHAYMFCSKRCKLKSADFYRKKSIEYLSEYGEYKRQVLKYTYKNLKNNKSKIKNYSNTTIGDGLELDHKFSISMGFENNINPKTIGYWKNLEFISMIKNRSKGKKCSITLKEILKIDNQRK